MSTPDAHSVDCYLPALDERLVTPETRYEMWNGELVFVAPVDHAHGELHSKVLVLVQASAAAGFTVVCDVLTRTSKKNDFAPDVAVVPLALDPVTGRRRIAELAFEIVSTVSLGKTGERAVELVRRGMRRMFAIDVRRECALEWDAALETWRILDSSGEIVDPALAVPLPIAALIRAGSADDAMARALIQKGTPAIEEVREQDRAAAKQQGLAEGLAAAILLALGSRGIALRIAERDRILGEADPALLQRWLQRAMTCATASALFEDP